jgi:exodeoxyribonuclease VII large subunit
VTELPPTAAQTTADQPWPVRLLAQKIAAYVDRMSPVWIEGQIVQLNRRPGSGMSFLTLRDTESDASLPVSILSRILDRTEGLTEGARVVVHAKAVFWTRRGTLSMQADEIRQLGVGELLARIEHLKRILAAEGLFDADRKVPLPFLPAAVGLICGRNSKAEHDVVVNARQRWPAVQFEIRQVAVQGTACVPEVTAALAELDAHPDVDVIVVARGGGSVEDLLGFSNETLVRAAAACRTPVVSAIGHETDTPLLDLVADYRASTPTEAAKRIVPDLTRERANLVQARNRLHLAVTNRIDQAQLALNTIRSRPVLANPTSRIDDLDMRLAQLRNRTHQLTAHRIELATAELTHLVAQVTALSPAATLQRGYAVVHGPDGGVLTNPDAVQAGDRLRIRLAGGELAATARPVED